MNTGEALLIGPARLAACSGGASGGSGDKGGGAVAIGLVVECELEKLQTTKLLPHPETVCLAFSK